MVNNQCYHPQCFMSQAQCALSVERLFKGCSFQASCIPSGHVEALCSCMANPLGCAKARFSADCSWVSFTLSIKWTAA